MEEIKRCPYCDELIRANAIKCKHCGSLLNGSSIEAERETNPKTRVTLALANRYEIIGEIGNGGMATVYKAVQKSLRRVVALKVIHQNLIHDKEFLERFHHEAQVAGSLSHPNIVTIYDEGSENGVHFMAMEYVEGEDLHYLINQKGKLRIDQTINVICSIAEALDYAHRKGLVHRDIKSANIILTKEGRVVLVDFGIAHAATSSNLSQAGTVIGTPEYMSPEQADGKPMDHRSDLYSLGIVMYECLTGILPFKGDNPITTIYKIIHSPHIELNQYGSYPEWLNTITNKVLFKDPAYRFNSGNELSKALRNRETVYVPKQESETPKTQRIKSGFAGNISDNSEKNKTSYGSGVKEKSKTQKGKILPPPGTRRNTSTGVYFAGGASVVIIIILLIMLLQNNSSSTSEVEIKEPEIEQPNSNEYENQSVNTPLLNDIAVILSKPVNSSSEIETAFLKIKEVLENDPHNQMALQYLSAIENWYTAEGNRYYESGRWQSALNIYLQAANYFGDKEPFSSRINDCRRKIESESLVTIPSLVGLSESGARNTAASLGLIIVTTTNRAGPQKDKGKVVIQIPNGGQKVKKGSSISITIGE